MEKKPNSSYDHAGIILDRMISKSSKSQNKFAEEDLGINGVNIAKARKSLQIPNRWFEVMQKKYGVTKDELCAPPVLVKTRAMVEHDYGRITEDGYELSDQDEKADSKDELMKMTSEVLDSDTVYRSALVSNIRAFHHGVKGEERMKNTDEKMDLMMKRMESMEKALTAFMSAAESIEPEKKRAINDH